MENLHDVFKSAQHHNISSLANETLFLQSQFFNPEDKDKKFILTFTESHIICTQTSSMQSIKYFIDYCFDIIFQMIYSNDDKVSPKKIGFKLLYNFQEIGEYHATQIYDLHQIQLFLKRKINQKGFHGCFRPLKKIGKGNFAAVYEVKRCLDHKKFAVKAFSKLNTYSSPDGKISLINELQILRKVNHKNILYLEGIYETQNSIYVTLQLIQGVQLYDLIKSSELNNCSLSDARKLIKGILSGLEHLHKKRIMHRDLKPENIMLRNGNWSQPVIVDFGLATNCDLQTYIFNRCGTPGYVSPQIINQKTPEHVEPICDIFSLGALFYAVLSKKPLFEGTKYEEVLKRNKYLDMNINEDQINLISPLALDLLKKMLVANPKERISAKEALKHEFFIQEKMNESFSTFI